MTRTEILAVCPESYDGTEAVPIMMGFHGFGSRHQDHMRMADMRPLASRKLYFGISTGHTPRRFHSLEYLRRR